MKFYLVIILILSAALAAWYVTSQPAADSATAQSQLPLRFSTTQSWDPEYTKVLREGVNEIAYYLPQLDVAPPPSTPEAIEAELEILQEYIALRTPEKVAEIEAELKVINATFNGKTLPEHLTDRPASAQLFNEALLLFEPVEVAFKERFDRVRPSYYDPTLTTAIPVPNHPAYPSYHAAEAMLTVLLLGRLDPENASAYLSDVDRISKNREIAGVHYPSDSTSGHRLAEDFLAIISTEAWFKNAYRQAEIEW